MKNQNIFSKTWFLLKNTFLEFNDDNAIKLSAALSYYTIFALPPLLIIIITICGFFFGEEAVTGQLYGQINGLVGNEAAIQIQNAIKKMQQHQRAKEVKKQAALKARQRHRPPRHAQPPKGPGRHPRREKAAGLSWWVFLPSATCRP